MGFGASIFLIAVGAILAFAVNVTVEGLELRTVGYILMAVGLAGLLLTMLYLGPRSRRAAVVRDEYVVREDPADRL